MEERYIDYMIVTLNRFYLDENEDLNKVIENLKNGFTPANSMEHDPIYFDSEEVRGLLPSENNNNSTIEVYVDNNLIWKNA